MKGGWRGKEGFTNACVVICSKVRHTPTGGDHNNALVLVGISLQGTDNGGKILGVIGGYWVMIGGRGGDTAAAVVV